LRKLALKQVATKASLQQNALKAKFLAISYIHYY